MGGGGAEPAGERVLEREMRYTSEGGGMHALKRDAEERQAAGGAGSDPLLHL